MDWWKENWMSVGSFVLAIAFGGSWIYMQVVGLPTTETFNSVVMAVVGFFFGGVASKLGK